MIQKLASVARHVYPKATAASIAENRIITDSLRTGGDAEEGNPVCRGRPPAVTSPAFPPSTVAMAVAQ